MLQLIVFVLTFLQKEISDLFIEFELFLPLIFESPHIVHCKLDLEHYPRPIVHTHHQAIVNVLNCCNLSLHLKIWLKKGKIIGDFTEEKVQEWIVLVDRSDSRFWQICRINNCSWNFCPVRLPSETTVLCKRKSISTMLTYWLFQSWSCVISSNGDLYWRSGSIFLFLIFGLNVRIDAEFNLFSFCLYGLYITFSFTSMPISFVCCFLSMCITCNF